MIDNTPYIDAIEKYIASEGSGYPKWYVGITDDVERRLFKEHNIPKHYWWIIRQTANKEAAEMIEKYFLDQGCQGAPRGGNEQSRVVYAYRITNSTIQ